MHGVPRLLKALRHEAPAGDDRRRLEGRSEASRAPGCSRPCTPAHTGKLSYVRVWRGEIADGVTLTASGSAASPRPRGKLDKTPKAGVGEVARSAGWRTPPPASCCPPRGKLAGAGVAGAADAAVRAGRPCRAARGRGQAVRRARAPGRGGSGSLSFGHDADTGEMLLWGQGEMHLRSRSTGCATASTCRSTRTGRRSPTRRRSAPAPASMPGTRSSPAATASSATSTSTSSRCRAAAGFVFIDTITGGAVPKQYIPAVETGVREYLNRARSASRSSTSR